MDGMIYGVGPDLIGRYEAIGDTKGFLEWASDGERLLIPPTWEMDGGGHLHPHAGITEDDVEDIESALYLMFSLRFLIDGSEAVSRGGLERLGAVFDVTPASDTPVFSEGIGVSPDDTLVSAAIPIRARSFAYANYLGRSSGFLGEVLDPDGKLDPVYSSYAELAGHLGSEEIVSIDDDGHILFWLDGGIVAGSDPDCYRKLAVALLDDLIDLHISSIGAKADGGRVIFTAPMKLDALWCAYLQDLAKPSTHVTVCEGCGKVVLDHQMRGSRRRFCCDACRSWFNKHPEAPGKRPVRSRLIPVSC